MEVGGRGLNQTFFIYFTPSSSKKINKSEVKPPPPQFLFRFKCVVCMLKKLHANSECNFIMQTVDLYLKQHVSDN